MFNKKCFELIFIVINLFCVSIYASDSGVVSPISGSTHPLNNSSMLFQTTGTVSCDGKVVGYKSYTINPNPFPPKSLACPFPLRMVINATPMSIYQTVELLIGGITFNSQNNEMKISLMCPTIVGNPGPNHETFNIQFICIA